MTSFTSSRATPFRHLALVCAAVLACTQARAVDVDVPLFDGSWSVVLPGSKPVPTVARVSLLDFSGTWLNADKRGPAPDRACLGKQFPITVQISTAAQLNFTAWGSAVSSKCPDLTVELKPVDPRSLQGTVNSGMTIQLVKRK